jgi:hypothetical protein
MRLRQGFRTDWIYLVGKCYLLGPSGARILSRVKRVFQLAAAATASLLFARPVAGQG